MGFDVEQARLLAQEVLSASARNCWSSASDPRRTRRRAVTTPGGTTEAAMRAFGERGAFAAAFRAGLEAARRRYGRKLSRG